MQHKYIFCVKQATFPFTKLEKMLQANIKLTAIWTSEHTTPNFKPSVQSR